MADQPRKLFISYRRADNRDFVSHIRTWFMRHYGRENVFMDFDSIPKFQDFADFIRKTVRECDVVIPIIGPQWLDILQDKATQSDPDYVRIELEEAIQYGKLLAPICIKGANFPDKNLVPSSLHPIWNNNAEELRDDRDILERIDSIIAALEAALEKHQGKPPKTISTPKPAPPMITRQSAPELGRAFLQAYKAIGDSDEALINALGLIQQLRASNATGLEVYKLDQREAELQTLLQEREAIRRRREAAGYLFELYLPLHEVGMPHEEVREAFQKVLEVDPDYPMGDLKDIYFPTWEFNQITRRILGDDLLFEWLEIPAGKVTLITEENWVENYIPKGEIRIFDVPAFWIAKYPVTNAQFAAFIAAGGYKEKRWWTEDGLVNGGWKETGTAWSEPNFWRDAKWNGAEYPVVGVSWYEAVAFCNWLNANLVGAQLIMLPTEQQWQRAVQGDDGRTYPWGDEFDPKNANTHESGIAKTTPVMAYPHGASPYGVLDMAGSVWEWCQTVYISGSENLEGTDARVLRGGSWGSHQDNARAVARLGLVPSLRSSTVGFRVCCGFRPS